jgi:hypothetical protein
MMMPSKYNINQNRPEMGVQRLIDYHATRVSNVLTKNLLLWSRNFVVDLVMFRDGTSPIGGLSRSACRFFDV